MKYSIMIFLALAIVNCTCGQGIGEFFSQKKTQLKYYAQQIAAYKVYLELLKKGYTICKDGLNTIGYIKDGNFNDHSSYFNSLKAVKPGIGKSSKAMMIAKYQSKILDEFSKLRRDCLGTSYLTASEAKYIDNVYNNMLKQCDITISDLQAVINDNSSQMSDDERIERLDQLYVDMKDKYKFTNSFVSSTYMLMAQRRRDADDVDVLNRLNSAL